MKRRAGISDKLLRCFEQIQEDKRFMSEIFKRKNTICIQREKIFMSEVLVKMQAESKH